MTSTARMYVDGAFVDAAGGETFQVFDPSTEAAIATVPAGGAVDLDRAVAAAHRAFSRDGWRRERAGARPGPLSPGGADSRPPGRAGGAGDDQLRQADRGVRDRHGRRRHLPRVLRGLATKSSGEVLPVPADAVALTLREPAGVAGQIILWNYPLRLIMRNAAEGLKRVSLELGGKSPNIFFADADFENAVEGALFGIFVNQGEVCSAGSRVLVQREIYRKFVEAAVAKARRIRLGPGLDREARLAVGGGTPKQLDRGWYLEPTIFYDVDNGARIAQEEIFGPVMSVIPFGDEADAIRIANATPYGLAAAVWTRDIFKAFRVVKALEAGVVWVNHMQPTFVEAPWGGYKASGFGRELGRWGIEEYLETKQVFINLDEKPIGWY